MKNPLFIFITAFLILHCGGDGPNFPSKKEKEAPVADEAAEEPSESPSFDGADENTNPLLPAILSFQASKMTITRGESVTLSWSTRLAQQVKLAPGIGVVGLNSSKVVTPVNTVTYSLMMEGPSGVNQGPYTQTVTIEVLPGEDSLEPPNGSCVPDEALAKQSLVQLFLKHQSVFPGEPLSIQWNASKMNLPAGSLVELYHKQTGVKLGEGISGSTDWIPPSQSGKVILKIKVCDELVFKEIEFQVVEIAEYDLPSASILAQGMTHSVWMGSQDGRIFAFDADKNKWKLISQARQKASSKPDTAPITAMIEMEGDCEGHWYMGTQSGHLYHSQDGGKSVSGLSGGNYPVHYFTTSIQKPLENPSAISFIVQDPNSSTGFYVGHKAGLVHFKDCRDPQIEGAGFLMPYKAMDSAVVWDEALYVLEDTHVHFIDALREWKALALKGSAQWIQASNEYLWIGTNQGVFEMPSEKQIFSDAWDFVFRWHDAVLVGDNQQTMIFRQSSTPSFLLEAIEGSPVFGVEDQNGFLWVLTKQGKIYSLKN